MSRFADNALIETISPHEQMELSGREHYFRAGRSALACIRAGLEEAGRKADDPTPYGVRTILDLPCGEGRVMRHLRHAFPRAEITGCDISRAGVDFCASTFGAIPLHSRPDPEEVPVRRGYYDLIWVGSLFTHLDAGKWRRFLKVFNEALAPDGILIFTTCGRRARDNMANRLAIYGHDEDELSELVRAYDEEGFGFVRYKGGDGHYGTSASTTDWVVDRIREVAGLRLVMHAASAWDNHQDCFTCRRGAPRGAGRRGRIDDGHPTTFARRALRLFSTRDNGRVRVAG